jgi:hypothetical protein
MEQSVASRKAVYLFIDALDEFRSTDIDQLLTLLMSIKSWNLPSMHVLVTSQCHKITIRSSLEMLTGIQSRLDLGRFNRADIRTYIQRCLRMPPLYSRWREDHSVFAEMEHALVNRSDGS